MRFRQNVTRPLVVLGTVAISTVLSGQAHPVANPPRVAVAVRAERPPRLDGTLNDAIWSTASVLEDFRQREPLETQSATENTEVRILYDSRHIYFGIYCHDTAPKGIVATQLRRDLSQDLDDNFAIVVDPTLSHRNGYIFEVNPLGTQRDGEVIEERSPPQDDSIVDSSWDGLWNSAAKVADGGVSDGQRNILIGCVRAQALAGSRISLVKSIL